MPDAAPAPKLDPSAGQVSAAAPDFDATGKAGGVVPGADPFFGASFTLGNRLRRMAWSVVYTLLFRPSPRPLHAWRAFLLRSFGARLGRNVHIYPTARIWAPWNLEVGDRGGIADGVKIYNMAQVRIGDYCSVSTGAHLCGGSHDADSANFQLVTGPIELEPYVWICAEAFIGINVRIPEGAVIAARSVVAKSPPEAWTVYAGVPARAIRGRSRALKDRIEAPGQKSDRQSGLPYS